MEQRIRDLSEPTIGAGSLHARRKSQVRDGGSAELRLASFSIGAKPGPSRSRSSFLDEPLTRLGDQLAQGVAVFSKTGRIVVTGQGVFIPRNVLGFGVNVEYQTESLPGGGVRVVVSGQPATKLLETARRGSVVDCSRELLWLAEHRDEFAGEWVALDGDRLVAHGQNAREVYDSARSLGVEVPSVARIEALDELPFGGW